MHFLKTKYNKGRESIYHCQGDPFDVLFALDHCGKLGFSINKCNKIVLINHVRMKINSNNILD